MIKCRGTAPRRRRTTASSSFGQGNQVRIGDVIKVAERSLDVARLDAEGLLLVERSGRRAMWIPDHADELKRRTLLCVYMIEAGN